jgi:hypothetical protein
MALVVLFLLIDVRRLQNDVRNDKGRITHFELFARSLWGRVEERRTVILIVSSVCRAM